MTPEDFNERSQGHLPGLLGLETVEVEPGRLVMRVDVRAEHLAPNGYLHAATVVGLADTACGYGCAASLPEGASGFTTIELKANFLGTALDGALSCVATLGHGGRTTQVWDAVVGVEGAGTTLALFRCTQLVLYPNPGSSAESGPVSTHREGRACHGQA
jgi:uncharacterized protein (TIGR00369 family)